MSLLSVLNRLAGGQDAVIAHDEMVRAVEARSHTIVDVREAAEFRSGTIRGAINVPLSAFDARRIPSGKPVIVFCATGGRSGMAQQMLKQAGFDQVVNYRPWISGWRLQGLPLV